MYLLQFPENDGFLQWFPIELSGDFNVVSRVSSSLGSQEKSGIFNVKSIFRAWKK